MTGVIADSVCTLSSLLCLFLGIMAGRASGSGRRRRAGLLWLICAAVIAVNAVVQLGAIR